MVVGTCCQACGANLQRLSATLEEKKAREGSKEPRPVRKQPLFILGIIMLVGGGIVSATALVFSAQSLLAPLILLMFVSNPIFAYYLNGEPFNPRTDGVCTAIIMTSVILVVYFAPHHSATYDAEHLRWLFTQPPFIAFAAIIAAFVASAWYVKRQLFLKSGMNWANLTDLRDLAIVHISYGVLAGTFGGLNITLTKCTFTLIIDEFEDGKKNGDFWGGVGGVLSSWALYVVSFSLLGTFFLEQKSIADGLQVGCAEASAFDRFVRAAQSRVSSLHLVSRPPTQHTLTRLPPRPPQVSSAMIVVSTLAVTEEIVATLGAMMYFQDFHLFTMKKAIVFGIGSFIGVVTVVIMATLRLRATHRPPADAAARPVGITIEMGVDMASADAGVGVGAESLGKADANASVLKAERDPDDGSMAAIEDGSPESRI